MGTWMISTAGILSVSALGLVAQGDVSTLGILQKLGEQAPGLAVLVFLVVVFLRHLRQEAKDRQEMGLACHAAHRSLAEEQKEISRRNQEVIDRNTQAHIENTQATRQMETMLHKVAEAVNKPRQQ